MTDHYTNASKAIRPYARLWVSLVLGALGMFLFRTEDRCFGPYAFAKLTGTTLFTWLAAACLGVVLLHRIEHHRTPRILYLFMGLALMFTLILFVSLGSIQHSEGREFTAFFCLAFILLILFAGASVAQPHFTEGVKPRSQTESIVRSLAVALTAPLVLFAYRVTNGDRSSSVLQRISQAVLALFPHILAIGFMLPFTLYHINRHWRLSWNGLHGVSFSTWVCLGCALIFVMNPWPDQPRMAGTAHLSKLRKKGSLAAVAFAGFTVFLALVFGQVVYLLMFFYPQTIGGGLGLGLALILIPWPEYPVIPKLGGLPEPRKMHPISTAFFLVIVLSSYGTIALRPFLKIVSGQLFTTPFDSEYLGRTLDQTTCTKWFFIFVTSSSLIIPYVAAARWMSNRKTRWGYWTFALPAIALWLSLLSFLTFPSFWLIQSVGELGWTLRRLLGLTYASLGYVVVSAFLCWAIWPERKEVTHGNVNPANQDESVDSLSNPVAP